MTPTLIRVSHLLSHQSRMINQWLNSQPTSKANIIDMLSSGNILLGGNIPGNYAYSNMGYNVLSEIVATKAKAQSFNPDSLAANVDFSYFEQFVRNNLFKPAGIDIGISHSPKLAVNLRAARKE